MLGRQAAGLLRRADRDARRPVCRSRCAHAAASGACARSTRWSTPAPPSSRRRRPTSTAPYEQENEAEPLDRAEGGVLGSGPIRIGQGIEFDYCCVRAAAALGTAAVASIMINSNPETVSTDFDASTRLYFEPLDEESVRDILENESPRARRRRHAGRRPVRRPDGDQPGRAARTGAAPACSAAARRAIDLAEDRRALRGSA